MDTHGRPVNALGLAGFGPRKEVSHAQETLEGVPCMETLRLRLCPRIGSDKTVDGPVSGLFVCVPVSGQANQRMALYRAF